MVFPMAAALLLAAALALPAHAGGEAGETAAAVAGTWRSLDDPKSVRVFAPDGTAKDRYAGESLATGTWEIADACPDASPEAGSATVGPLLVVRYAEDPAPFCYGLGDIGADRLELIYLPRGNTLRYARVRP
jgi:hypothetical protein